jgi:DNA-binding transcriptional regulator GbsR (MarR family)
MTESELIAEVARLKELLQQANARDLEFRKEIYSDPEFLVIFKRRQHERSLQRSVDYNTKLLLKILEQLEEKSLATEPVETVAEAVETSEPAVCPF